jgi:hypothetical protein
VVPRLEALEDRCVPALVVSELPSAAAADQLVQSLVGSGVTVSNVSFKGSAGTGVASAGTFTGGTGIIGFEQGITLSSGHVKDLPGPSTNFASTDLGLPGDPDLDAIVGSTGFDATVLEFDFVPRGANLSFQFVFGSEEYNEFVGSEFNDVFAFLLNGKNVALVPGTNTPVSINNVNKNSNSQFFIDNDPADFGGGPGPVQTALNGLTTVLTVQATVTPNVTNHIKLAIQDVSDGILDSAVFIKAGSFSVGAKPVGYHPFRYVLHPQTQTYDGNITVTNVGDTPLTGPLVVLLSGLPPGVQVANATPVTTSTGATVLVLPLPIASLNPQQVARVPVKLSNPLRVPMSTFFEGYEIDVTTLASVIG